MMRRFNASKRKHQLRSTRRYDASHQLSVLRFEALEDRRLLFSPYTHISAAEQVLADLTDDSQLTIAGQDYDVRPEVIAALRDYPAYYRAGVVGPDSYPDVPLGAGIIHAENAGLWARHVFREAWAAQTDPGYDAAERSQILAWSYGFLTHMAGDVWAHTLVNDLAGGVWPAIGDIPSEAQNAAIVLRHLAIEGYIADYTPGYDGNPTRNPGDTSDTTTPELVFAVPHEFVYKTLIEPDNGLHTETRGVLIDRFLSLRATLEGLKTPANRDLRSEASTAVSDVLGSLDAAEAAFDAAAGPCFDTFDLTACVQSLGNLAKWGAVNSAAAFESFRLSTLDDLATALFDSYLNEWIGNIDAGLRHWTEFSLAVSNALLNPQTRRDAQDYLCAPRGGEFDPARIACEDDVGFLDVISYATTDFVNDYLLGMLGAPDFLGGLREKLQDFAHTLDLALGPAFNPMRLTQDALRDLSQTISHTALEATFGVDLNLLESFLKTPSAMLDVTEIDLGPTFGVTPLFQPGDHARLDQLLGIVGTDHHETTDPKVLKADEAFDPTSPTVFAAYANTVTMSKLLLLDGATLDDVLGDIIGEPGFAFYQLVDTDLPVRGNVMLTPLPGVGATELLSSELMDSRYRNQQWLHSIDHDHAWRADGLPAFANSNAAGAHNRPLDDGFPNSGGLGNFPLWESATLRPAFRVLFRDWENPQGFTDFRDDYGDAPTINPVERLDDPGVAAALEAGLAETIEWFGSLDGAASPPASSNSPPVPAASPDALALLAQPLPLVGMSVGQALDIEGLLRQLLLEPVEAYFGGDATPTAAELVAVLSQLSTTVGDVQADVAPLGAGGGLAQTALGEELAFSIRLTASRTRTDVPLLLPSQDVWGITLGAAATVDLTATLAIGLTFGYDLTPGVSAADAFFIYIHELTPGVTVRTDDLNFSAKVGFLDIGIEDGIVNLDAELPFEVVDPGPDLLGRISLADLQATSPAMLFDVAAPTATFYANLPVTGGLGGFSLSPFYSTRPSIEVEDDDSFDATPPQTRVENFDELLNFNALSPQTVVAALEQLAGWLDNFSQSAVMATPIPLTGGTTLGDVVAWGETFAARIVSPLKSLTSTPLFDTAEELANRLAEALGLDIAAIDADYNCFTDELTYKLNLSDVLQPIDVPIDFDLELGSVGLLSTSSTLRVTGSADIELTLGFKLSPLVAVVTAAGTAPSDGVLSSDAHFALTVGDGGPMPIVVPRDDANTSVADLVADINAAIDATCLSGRVTASHDNGTLRLAARVIDSAPSFHLEATAGDSAITDLHFAATNAATASTLDRLFVRDPRLTASLHMAADDVDALARFGFIGIEVVNGSATADASIDVSLTDPGTVDPDGDISITELWTALSDVSTLVPSPEVSGSAHVVLPIRLNPNFLGAEHPADPRITVDWPDITNAGTLTLNFNEDMQELANFEYVSQLDVIDALASAAEYLASLEEFSFLGEKLPLVNRSVSDILGYAAEFTRQVQSVRDDPGATLQELERRLEVALGLVPDSPLVNLSFDGTALRIELVAAAAFDESVAIDLDLAALSAAAGGVPGLENVSRLVDLSGSGVLSLAASATANIQLGIDVADPSDPRSFLYDTTELVVEVRATGTDLNFDAPLGPLGVYIRSGVAVLDGDGIIGTTAPARFSVSLVDPNGDGRIDFAELASLNPAIVDVDLTGQVRATLPVYFPSQTTWLGDIDLRITSLSDIPGTIELTAPPISGQFGLVNLLDNLGVVVIGLDSVLARMQDALDGVVFAARLPLIGRDLQKSAKFIDRLREEAVQPLADLLTDTPPVDAVRQGLFDILGPSGLNLLDKDFHDELSDNVPDAAANLDDVVLEVSMGGNQIQFNVRLKRAMELVDAPIAFDVGLPALGLEVDGDVSLRLGYELTLGFGVNIAQGFYFDTSPQNELLVELEATIPGMTATGHLGFLRVDVEDDPTMPSRLTGSFAIDLMDPIDNPLDPDDDDQLSILDLASVGELSDVVNARFSAMADVNLRLATSFVTDARFPSISADFHLDWTFLNANPSGNPAALGNRPHVVFSNITLPIAEFFDHFAGPILGQIKDLIEPIQPLIKFLTDPLPVISDLPGIDDVSILDIIAVLPPINGIDITQDQVEFFEAAARLIGLIDKIPENFADLQIALGSFEIGGQGGTGDLRRILGSVSDDDLDHVQEMDTAPQLQQDHDVGDFFDEAADIDGGVSFPILTDPSQVFELLLGGDATLFKYQLPELRAELTFKREWQPFPPVPLFGTFRGVLGATANLGFGYDTSGLRRYRESGDWRDVFGGFFIDDHATYDSRGEPIKDDPEATIYGSVTVGVQLGTGIAGGIEGGLFGTVNIDLMDPIPDGAVHFDELVASLDEGLLCTFAVSGEVRAKILAYLEVAGERTSEKKLGESGPILSFDLSPDQCFSSRFESNNVIDTAADIGVAPGIHLADLSLMPAGDTDWYRFDLLRPDSVTIVAKGDVKLEATNANGSLLGRGTDEGGKTRLTLQNLAAGTYYVHVYGNAVGNYDLSIDAATGTSHSGLLGPQGTPTRVFYVNDPTVTDPTVASFYSLEPGDDANDGLSPRTPKATVQSVLATYDLGENDLVLIDSGAYGSGAITLGVADSGAMFAGAPEGSVFGSGSRWRLVGADDVVIDALTFEGGGGPAIEIDYARTMPADESNDNVLRRIVFRDVGTAIRIDRGSGNLVERNRIDGAAALGIDAVSPTALTIRDNEFFDTPTAIRLDRAPGGVVQANTIFGATATAIHTIDATGTIIRTNVIEDAATGILIVGGDGTTVDDNAILATNTGVLAQNAADLTVSGNVLTAVQTGVRLEDVQSGALINNVVTATGLYGMWLRGGGAWTIRGNVVEGAAEGVLISTTSGQSLDLNARNNLVTASSTGFRVADAGVSGRLTANEFHDSGTGLIVTASGVEVDDNEFRGNQTGLRLSGSAATVHDNDMHHNAIGVHVTSGVANIYGNSIHDNTVGVRSDATFGPASWSMADPNDVFRNATGIEALGGATIQFNRLHHNVIGVRVAGAAHVHHNVAYRNTDAGILVSAVTGATVESNTIYAPAGDAVRLDGPTTNLVLRNNVLWAESGFALASPTDNHAGLVSDFNNLYVSGSGKLVLWKKEINDLLNWQVETDFDMHSIGYTTIDPGRDNPRFVDLANDDYHLLDAVSTSIDAGDRLAAFNAEPVPNGGRIDLGAYGNTSEAAMSPASSRLEIDYPNYYTDWTTDEGRFIRWAGYNVAGNVHIELYEEGVGKIGDVAVVSASAGPYLWSPGDNGLAGDPTRRYRLRISSVNDPAVFIFSRETFSVPPETAVFYVNDALTPQDEYATAAGNNRSTGRTPADPKPSLLAVLKSYDLDAGDTVYVDAGEYRHLADAVLSGDLAIGNDEGMTVTGPGDSARVARLVQFSDRPSQAAIDVNNADFVTISHLTLVGAPTGLWVRNGATDFRAVFVTTNGHVLDGLRIDTGSSAASLASIIAIDNGRYGINTQGPLGELVDSTIYGNRNTGVLLSASGSPLVANNLIHSNRGDGITIPGAEGARIEANRIYGNLGQGLLLSASGLLTTIGHDDLSLGRGNIVYDNGQNGIYATGAVRVVGNTVYGHSANNQIGIYGAKEITSNVVFGNDIGIHSTDTVSTNRVYQNRTTGIVTGASGRVSGNVVYSNGVGIQIGCCGLYNAAELTNNLVYANATIGIRAYPGNGIKLINNTVYQPFGNALVFEGDTTAFAMRNNIFSVAVGYAINAGSFNLPQLASDYNNFFVTGTGQVGVWQGIARATLAQWRSASFTDGNSLAQNPLFIDPDGGDNLIGYSSVLADGRDDDFHLQGLYGSFHGGSSAPVVATAPGLPVAMPPMESLDAAQSPLIDVGAASDSFAAEPLPNGGFVNLGTYGNTPQASKSPPTYVRVLSPDGGEAWPVEQSFAIRWRSNDPLAGYALAFDGMDDYVAIAEPTDGSLDLGTSATLEAWVKFAALPNNSLATILSKDQGGGQQNKWIFGYARNYGNIANATFFHINSPAGGAVFLTSNPWTPDIGRWYHLAVVRSGNQFDFYRDGVLDGTATTAFAVPQVAYPVEIGRAEGFAYFNGTLDDVRIWNTSRQPAEIQAAMTEGVTGGEAGLVAAWDFQQGVGNIAIDRTPHGHDGTLGGGIATRRPAWVTRTQAVTVDIDLLQAGEQASVLSIADDTPNDGEFVWTVPLTLEPAADYAIRVTRTDNGATDASNAAFSISPPVNHYYVNDATVDAGDWTTASGNDANDGLTPGSPKASVRAILETYDLGPTDTVLVDAGLYLLTTNLTITAADSGVTIVGYHDAAFPDRRAVLNRGATAASNHVFELVNADDVTLDHLSLTGGYYAVYAVSGSDSDRLTLSNNDISGYAGVRLELANDGAVIVGNFVHDLASGAYYLYVHGFDSTVVGNRIGRNGAAADGTGVNLGGERNTIQGNEIWNLNYGITNGGGGSGAANRNVIVGNLIHDNLYVGIQDGGNTLITGNTVYGQRGPGDVGIFGYGVGLIENNEVYDNATGLQLQGGTARNNRVYGNNQIGIVTGASAVITGNTVYSNPLGIQVGCCGLYNAAQVTNNLVYANTTAGILIGRSYAANGVLIGNNTVYQLQGDALVFEGDTSLVSVKNNVLVSGGYVINGASYNLLGLTSDYNVLNATGAAKLARWQNRDFTSRVDWFYELGLDAHSQTVDPQFVDIDGPDNQLGYVSGVDYGLDDDFSLLTTSPGVDAGNPADSFVLEPNPNGGRINIGHQGNTPQATNSPLQTVQVLSPNGLEKFETNQTVAIQWRSAGLPVEATVAIDVSIDDGMSWTPLAAGLPGNGTYAFTPTVATLGNLALVRVRADTPLAPQDTSDTAFLIANSGADYYVNDGATTGDAFTTALGDNANSGKSPSSPMASLSALLAAYDLDSGDVVHVDAGTYDLVKNVVITSQDSGVRIEGPTTAAAILNRGAVASSNHVFELVNADDVTLDHLSLTGGYHAVYAASGSDSDRLTLSNNDIYGYVGVHLESTNDQAVIVNNFVHDLASGANYIFVRGNDTTIVGNRIGRTVATDGTGLSLHGERNKAQANEIWHLNYGINNSGGGSGEANRNVIVGNLIHDNLYAGIQNGGNAHVTGNTIYGQRESVGDMGIHSFGIGLIENNEVYDNAIGIVVYGGLTRNNRVYRNSQVGIMATQSAMVQGNTVYSNPLGLQVGCCGVYNSAQVTNNLVYANTTAGILVGRTYAANGALVANNTVYQPQGDALVFEADTLLVSVKNNILVSGGGYVINGGGYNVLGLASDYNLLFASGSAKLARWQNRDFTSRADWFYELGFDTHSQTVDPQFVDIDGLDNQLGFVSGVDYGLDDNFSLLTTSPGVDAGNPADAFALESSPNGGQINSGHHGNTPQATNSPLQLVQILSPDGLEKVERGQSVAIQWSFHGLPANGDQDALLAHAPLVYYRFDESSGTVAVDSSANALHATYTNGVTLGTTGGLSDATNRAARFDGQNDYVAVPATNLFDTAQLSVEAWVNPDPATADFTPVLLKTSSDAWDDGWGLFWNGAGSLRFFVNHWYDSASAAVDVAVPTNAWSHVAATYDGAMVRIYLNGTLAAAKAYTSPIRHGSRPLSIGQRECCSPRYWKGGLDEVAVYGVALSAVAVQAHYLRQSYGTARIELFGANDPTPVLTIATTTPNSNRYDWTVPANLAEGEYRIRVTANSGLQPEDTSDASFLIANSGADYYVNDGATTGDAFTTALGDNANSGKSPSSPMASLSALLAAYDLDSGDVVHVDAGTYDLVKNVVITSQDSGVRIEGPTTAAAILNRGAVASSNHVFELVNADDVTLDHLSLTGGYHAVYAASGSDSDRLTLSNNDIYGYVGVHLESTNDQAVIVNNFVHDLASGANYIFVRGNDTTIVGNRIGRTVATDGTGLSLHGERNKAQANEIWHLNYGINNSGGGSGEANRNVIVGNLIHDNLYAGIQNGGNAHVTGNTIYGQRESVGDMGIHSFGIGLIENNEVYDNAIGIVVYGGLTRNNRVYRNSQVGIMATQSAMVQGNTVYSNPLGLQVGCCGVYNSAQVTNNLVYANTEYGIVVGRTYDANGALIVNNTVYQSVGDAIRVETGSNNLTIKNNILAFGAGYGLNFLTTNHTNRAWDYNQFDRLTQTQASVAFWGGEARATLADWQVAAAQDVNSLAASAGFVDINGADDVLAFSAGSGYDGGRDDNFHLAAGSLAIDRGDANAAPLTDRNGQGRADDPGSPNLGNPVGSFVDLGAFEFHGSSIDVDPPVIVGTQPAAIAAGGRIALLVDVTLLLSEPLNANDAAATSNFELRASGINGLFGDEDDIVYVLTPEYGIGTTAVILHPEIGSLPDGDYRITVSPTGSLRDESGLALDGDGDGAPGGAWMRVFTVGFTIGDFDGDDDVDAADIDALFAAIAIGAVDPRYDLDGDGRVDAADVGELVVGILNTRPGDANLDGRVDRADVALLASRFGRVGVPRWSDGDFDGDGMTGLVDLGLLQRNLLVSQSTSMPGDFDGDQNVDADDIDRLFAAIAGGATAEAFDVNHDGNIDYGDVVYVVENILHTRIGDVDLDGRVDEADIAIVATNFGQSSERRWSLGDIDGDSRVSLADLASLQRRLGQGSTASPIIAPAARATIAAVFRNAAAKQVDQAILLAVAHRRMTVVSPKNSVLAARTGPLPADRRPKVALSVRIVNGPTEVNLRATRHRRAGPVDEEYVTMIDTAVEHVSRERRLRRIIA
ncbi:MAG: right-handed parallel beta-helix repeat-containing protein [Pirellulales bacterium]